MKHLIYLSYELDIRAGGPAGYLANLKCGLDELSDERFIFFTPKTNAKFFHRIFNRLKRSYKKKSNKRKSWLEKFFDKDLDLPKNIQSYSSIHFHSTEDLYFFYTKYSSILLNKKVFLTSHSPELPSLELVSRLTNIHVVNYDNRDEYYKRLYLIDETSFGLANCIIFPTKDSMEPYLVDKKMQEIFQDKCLDYLLTGCNRPVVEFSRDEYRKKIGVGSKQFVIGYIGRHNEIKGYDILLKIAKNLNISDFKFVIAGDESPLNGLDEEYWLELGRIEDVGSFLNSIDLLLLPNRQTYFDLIVLEALSIGTPIMMSYNGGNKWFYGKSKGLFHIRDYINHLEWCSQIVEYKNVIFSDFEQLSLENRTLYDKHFTVKEFAKQYVSLIHDLNERL